MKRLSPIFFLLAIGAWYVQKHPSMETWSITFQEWNQKSPLPLWNISLVIGLILFFTKSSTKAKPRVSTPKVKKPIVQKKQPSPSLHTPPHVQSHDDTETEEWRAVLTQKVQTLKFPRGGKVRIDPQKDTPFMLILPHKTHQAYKDSIDIFAQWLSTIPTPKRVLIRFDAGCSEKEQQLVRAAIRKQYHINDMMVRKDTNQIDILFHHPDQKWGSKYNLNKDFQLK